MRRLLLSSAILFISCLCNAQTATVSATIQDPTAQVFANGTCTIQFVPTPGTPGPFTQGSNTFSAGTTVPCTLDGTGSFSLSITRNDFINPAGSKWQFTVCPNADSSCTQVAIPITSASINVSSTINALVQNIQVFGGRTVPRAYSDSEIVITPNAGQGYWNTTQGTLKFWNGASWVTALVQGSNPSFTNFSWSGTATGGSFSGSIGGNFNMTGAITLGATGSLNGAVINGICTIDGVHYTKIADVANDSNCTALRFPATPGCYQETLSASVTLHGILSIKAEGCAKINMNGTNQLLLTGGGTVADNFTITSDFPWSDHGNGVNSGLQFTGYTGTDSPLKIGNGTNGSTRTENVLIANTDIVLGNGSGAAGVKLINVQNFKVDKVNVILGGPNQICYLVDGTGNFAGVGEIDQPNCQGSGTGQQGVRAQVGVTSLTVSQGNFQLTNTGTACFDANNSDMSLVWPNCNSAASAITTESGGTVTGFMRRDSGVSVVATWGTGTGGSYVICPTCHFSPFGGNTVVNNSAFDNFIITADGGLSSDAWMWRCTTARGRCDLFDSVNSLNAFTVFPNGNMFLGNPSSRVKLITPESTSAGIFLDGATSGTFQIIPTGTVGTNSAVAPAASGGLGTIGTGSTTSLTGFTQTAQASGAATTGGASAWTGSSSTTVTWPISFGDTNYRTTCLPLGTTSGVPVLQELNTTSATSVSVVTQQATGANAQFTTIICTAIHN